MHIIILNLKILLGYVTKLLVCILCPGGKAVNPDLSAYPSLVLALCILLRWYLIKEYLFKNHSQMSVPWMIEKTIYYLNILFTKAFKLEITYHPHILVIHIIFLFMHISFS